MELNVGGFRTKDQRKYYRRQPWSPAEMLLQVDQADPGRREPLQAAGQDGSALPHKSDTAIPLNRKSQEGRGHLCLDSEL